MKELERSNRVAMIAHGVINACMLFISVIGFVAENILNKKSRIIQWRELAELPADTIRIDVRTHDEYKLGTIPGFINIPVDELREH